MKNTIKDILFGTALFVSCACWASCKKFLEIDKPINQLTTEAVFADSASIESAINGFYASHTDNFARFLNGRMTLATSLAADDVFPATSGTTPNAFVTNTILTNNSENTACWTEAYKSIYHGNSILENLKNTTVISKNLKDRISAEMKTMRALNYFYLVNLYGAVPLVLTTSYTNNQLLVRSSTDDVYQQIITDLKEAQTVMNSQAVTLNKLRINKWAVSALLARVYLYRKDYGNAITQASDIINSGMFSMPSLNNAFTIASAETIFHIMPSVAGPYNAGEGFYFMPPATNVVPTYSLRQELLNAFETGDNRRQYWTSNNTVSGTTYFYPAKYKVRQLSPNTTKNEYDVVFRLGEQYLIRAEAYAQSGNSVLALKDLDVVRVRAGLPLLSLTNPGLTGTNLLNAVYHERQTELFAEWGHRWLDLKRTGRADATLAPVKGANWQTTDQLFPIPESELIANPNLTQNAGY